MCIRDRHLLDLGIPADAIAALTFTNKAAEEMRERIAHLLGCLLYTSDAADERSSVDLGGRRIIKKKNREQTSGLGISVRQ